MKNNKLSREDRRLDRSFNRLVRKAIRKRKKGGQPIARYSKERGIWIEYPKVKTSKFVEEYLGLKLTRPQKLVVYFCDFATTMCDKMRCRHV